MVDRLRRSSIHIFIIFSLILFIHRNFIDCYDYPLGKNNAIVQKVRARINAMHAKTIGYIIGLGTTWRMYSPTWRYFPWFEWYAQAPSGEWLRVESRNLSPDYVVRRSWYAQPFFDNKLGMLQTTLTQTSRYRQDYADYICRDVRSRQGWPPVAIRLEERRKYIPPPGDPSDWSPLTSPPDFSTQWEYPCTD